MDIDFIPKYISKILIMIERMSFFFLMNTFDNEIFVWLKSQLVFRYVRYFVDFYYFQL